MFIILWRFVVHPQHVDDFVRHYSAGGTWAELFKRSSSYLGTDLIRSSDDATIFVTIDRWRSGDAFTQFEREHHADYARLDTECSTLTVHEELLGRYENLD
jgi:quinol monooxygenase YgiN